MSVNKITLDTNILVYAFDSSCEKRHLMAIKVIEKVASSQCVLTLQALAEFFNVLTRKYSIPPKKVSEHISELLKIFPLIHAKQNNFEKAMEAVSHYKMAFWDAMLWATAQGSKVTLILSEDFQHMQILDGVRIINPFLPNEFWTVAE